MHICDYGAGNGYLTKSLIEAGYNILAYEPYLNNGTYLDKRYYRTKPFATDVMNNIAYPAGRIEQLHFAPNRGI